MITIGVGGADAVDVMADLPWELKAPKVNYFWFSFFFFFYSCERKKTSNQFYSLCECHVLVYWS